MKNELTIAIRETRSAFVTPLAYIVISSFLVLSGFFFFSLLQQFNGLTAQASMMQNAHPSLNDWVVKPYYQTLEIILIFLLPVLTMRLIAEEKRCGTFELLLTSPLTSGEIVLGKFLGTATVVGIMLLLSFVYPLALVIFADPELYPILIGFFGVVLFAYAYSALGIAISAFSRSQTSAGVLGLVLFLVFYVIDAPAESVGALPASILRFLAPSNHAEAMLKGVLTGTDIVYFSSLILFGLFMANRAIDAQRWR